MGAAAFYEKRAKKVSAKKTVRKRKVKNAALRKKSSTVENFLSTTAEKLVKS